MEIFQPSFRGKNLSARQDSRGKYIEMTGEEALLYIPAGVLPNVVYSIKVEMAKKSGNGIIYCNIYGNKNYDFPQVKLICDTSDWTQYSFFVETRDFPKTVPMVFRMWRNPGGTGSILVRKIIIELVEKNNNNLGIVQKEDIGTVENSVPLSIESSEPVGPLPEIKPIADPSNIKKLRPISSTEKAPKPEPIPMEPTRCYHSAGDTSLFYCTQPKTFPVEIGEDGIKVSAVISLYNRIEYLDRTFFTFTKQTMPKSEFEIVVVDDQSTDDILGLCKKYSKEAGLRFQYILIDKSKGAIPPASFNQALTNNIGFKQARGKVVVITGPETLLKEDCLELSWDAANEGRCVYGDIYRSSNIFVEFLKNNDWKSLEFSNLLDAPGAKAETTQLGGFWWYYVAVRKEHIMNINGVDERYMRGITAEDDNFAFRMHQSGVPLVRNHKIIGIHQDHSSTDKDDLHSIRQDANEWRKLRNHNISLLNDWFVKKQAVANTNLDWGTDKAIIKKEVF